LFGLLYQLFGGYVQFDAYVETGTATWGKYQPIQLQILLSLTTCLLAYCPFSATDKGLGTTRRQTAAKAAARQGRGKNNNQPLAKAKAMAAVIHNNNVSRCHCEMIDWAIMAVTNNDQVGSTMCMPMQQYHSYHLVAQPAVVAVKYSLMQHQSM